MVKLEEIEFMTFLPRIERFFPNISIKDFAFIKRFVKEHQITNYKELSDVLSEYVDIHTLDPARAILGSVISEMERTNEIGVEIEKYLSKGYNFNDIPIEVVKKTECTTYGNCLPYSPPTGIKKSKECAVSQFSIDQIKYLLSHTTTRGESAFTHGFFRISTSGALDTIKLINFFEEQITRQYKETLITDKNLFDLNKKEKRLLVQEQLSDIVSYLATLEGEYIWGGVSSFQDKKFVPAVSSDNERYILIRNNLVDTISNYTTLKELETGFEKTKCLDRFKSTSYKK